jgi:hypothetical protein
VVSGEVDVLARVEHMNGGRMAQGKNRIIARATATIPNPSAGS